MPNALLGLLHDHRHLGIHTELLTDGLVDLIESGAATGLSKATRPGKVVTTFALGTQKTYDYIADNPVVEMLPVDWVNDPRVIGREQRFVSINSTLEVDFLGQCNSEVLNGRYWSGSGGQADFARGAMHSPEGQGFVVLHATTRDGVGVADRAASVSRRRGHDRQEHRRQGGHRVRRGRAAGSHHRRANEGPDRHRPPGAPGRARSRRARARLPQGLVRAGAARRSPAGVDARRESGGGPRWVAA